MPLAAQVPLTLAAVPGSYLVATGDYNAFVSKYGYIGTIVPVVSVRVFIHMHMSGWLKRIPAAHLNLNVNGRGKLRLLPVRDLRNVGGRIVTIYPV